ncbi:39S ribosomal protein L40, mitochondrial-like [Ctenocephalides felis]|uniref:39S ribosomal protein L40, mitochondrial-like n=1 Tax=Ctenocephalides felis TaxID=7515 RepID=UPI000E6E1E28|nr:39S ribosomal protein L40, mitochondrial-like [Ctenocephalides felis]
MFASVLSSFRNLAISQTRLISIYSPACIQASPCLYAEPLKKKKRMDPQIVRQREERRRKKLEKQIRRLEKNARQLKPIDELDVPLVLIDQNKQRTRPVVKHTEEELERRAMLQKEWTQARTRTYLADYQMIDRILASQRKALDELRKESEELYLEAVQIDQELLPFTTTGPTITPPIKNYESPDGEYIDISKKWD